VSNIFLYLSYVIYEIFTNLLEGERGYRMISRNMAKKKFLHVRMKSKIHKVIMLLLIAFGRVSV